MPTADDPPRPTRRALGRGPGIRPAEGPEAPYEVPAAVPAAPAVPYEGPAAAPAAPVAATEAPTARVTPAEAAPAPATAGEAPAAPAKAPVVPTETPAAPAAPAKASGASTEAPAAPDADESAGSPAEAPVAPDGDDRRFTVRLVNFEGPFDLLLQLISKHKLDVTEVALSKVTDEFMAHIRAMGADWDLDQTTEFLVVAATLLDLKAARLLPTAEVEDEADLALLEARDLLFARLLQYRAYKRIAEIFSDRLESESRRYPRTVGLEPQHAELLPEVVISIGPEGFARLAVKAMQPKAKPQVYVDHIHAPLVSVREQAEIVVARLRAEGEISFQELTADAEDTLTVVARFLALLELYREKAVALDQEEALGDLLVRWAGGEGTEPVVTDEFDQEAREPEEDVQA
ncbi:MULTISPECIES: ScpA family protein [unclassified Streptomyces]|uniref:segregation and condensation protein A n=1 Tax=unclassified Streptomyces TaxID=2593676 RepID=UPI0029B3B220|nr:MULTISPECIES: ScpA family protein [unclassified Streptomyces]MDX3687543.1 ScpA family protein [Streptomyces sp. AK04-4c]